MPTATYEVLIDWGNDGSFATSGDDVSADVMSVDIRRGFSDSLSRVAKVGRCQIVLKNSSRNYSPELQASVLPRRQVSVKADSIPLFRGFLESIEPDFGSNLRRRVKLECVDAIELLQDAEILVALQENKRGDELISSIVANVFTPPGTAYDVDTDNFPFAADRWTDDIVYGAGKQERALPAIRDVCMSNWGRFYIRADGYPVFENRHHRLLDQTSQATLADTMVKLGYKKGTDQLYNEIKVTAYPRTVGASNEVLWAQEAGSIPSVEMGVTAIVSARFRDANNKTVEMGGKSVVSPVATTDYLMNSASNGSGANLTANFTVTATVYASHAEISITNNGAVTGYVTLLQIRGLAVRSYAPPVLIASDAASQTTYKSKRTLPIDSILQDDTNLAQDLANYLLGLFSTPPGEIGGIVFKARRNATFLGYMKDLEISDRVTISETQTGVNGDYFINAISHRISDCGLRHEVELDVEKADAASFWKLDISELGLSTRLAY